MNYIIARYKSKCAETGKIIKKGDNCLHDASNKVVYHMDSQKAKKWQENELNSESESHRQAGIMAQAEQEAGFDNFCQRNGI